MFSTEDTQLANRDMKDAQHHREMQIGTVARSRPAPVSTAIAKKTRTSGRGRGREGTASWRSPCRKQAEGVPQDLKIKPATRFLGSSPKARRREP